eukprot:snap_masked-scaffold_10-processed-gene-9.22-mRNA-1 protein AED:0.47 eAED:0.47 QI:0/-1/0/1/-1/1/1/0/822
MNEQTIISKIQALQEDLKQQQGGDLSTEEKANIQNIATGNNILSNSKSIHDPTIQQETETKFIVCCIHRPVKISRSDKGEGFTYLKSNSWFKYSLDTFTSATKQNLTWVTWNGIYIEEPFQEGVREKLLNEFNCHPVFLEKIISQRFYDIFCCTVLWKILHNFQYSQVQSDVSESYAAYVKANNAFLDTISSVYNDGDTILVHGFSLMLLPGMLRRRFPKIKVAFFLNTPFPSNEFWRILPPREDLLKGVLGADLVSFCHYNYVRHFIHTCTYILGLNANPRQVEFERRDIFMSYQPLGIELNSPRFKHVLDNNEKYLDKVEELREHFKDKVVIVSRDKLDYVQGVIQKFMAFEAFLEKYPEYIGKAVLCQVVTESKLARNRYSRTNDAKFLAKQINTLAGEINGKYSTALSMYTPIKLLTKGLDAEEQDALNRVAKVCLNTSLREAFSVFVLEYTACQDLNDPGVVLYSEFTGCATSLKGAIIINPHAAEDVADSIERAIKMPREKRVSRINKLMNFVKTYTTGEWIKRLHFLVEKAWIKAQEVQITPYVNIQFLSNEYLRAEKCLILLDYRGTLVNFHSIPQLNKPDEYLMETLRKLVYFERNIVYIIDTLSSKMMDSFFSGLGCGMIAENGYKVKHPGEHHWIHVGKNKNKEQGFYWKEDILSVFKSFAERTPGSFLDAGESYVTWHFMDTDEGYGDLQAKSLQIQLEQILKFHPLDSHLSLRKKYIYVQPSGIHKGRAIRNILNQYKVKNKIDEMEYDLDLILCFGDDKTDERMFSEIESKKTLYSWLCSVGERVSHSKYFIESSVEAVNILSTLSNS